MCHAIYIVNTQQTHEKGIVDNFSDSQLIINNRQKLDSFDAHYDKSFKYTPPHTDLCKYKKFKVVQNIIIIEEMKSYTKHK